MRVLVCGGRDYDDMSSVHRELSALKPAWIIHGAARGADSLAGKWAELHGVRTEEYPADWSKHGTAAGPIRNRRMLEEGKPDLVVAFPGGKGTANMVMQARRAGVPVVEVGDE